MSVGLAKRVKVNSGHCPEQGLGFQWLKGQQASESGAVSPRDSARCLHLLTSGPVIDLSTPLRMKNPQVPFSYEFPEGEGGR